MPVPHPRLGLGPADRDADTVIGDLERGCLVIGRQHHRDMPGAPGRERIFHRVAHRLRHDERQWHRLIGRHLQRRGLDSELQPPARHLAHCHEQLLAELHQELAHVYRVHLAMRIQMPVQRRQRAHPVAGGLELGPRLRQADSAGLQVQQAGDDLQVVFHAMVNFLHRQFLLAHGRVEPGLVMRQHQGRSLERDAEPAQGDRVEPDVRQVERAAVAPPIHGHPQPGHRSIDQPPRHQAGYGHTSRPEQECPGHAATRGQQGQRQRAGSAAERRQGA